MQKSKGNYFHISDRMIRTVQMLVCSSSVLMCFRVRGILLGLGKSMSLLTEAELAQLAQQQQQSQSQPCLAPEA